MLVFFSRNPVQYNDIFSPHKRLASVEFNTKVTMLPKKSRTPVYICQSISQQNNIYQTADAFWSISRNGNEGEPLTGRMQCSEGNSRITLRNTDKQSPCCKAWDNPTHVWMRTVCASVQPRGGDVNLIKSIRAWRACPSLCREQRQWSKVTNNSPTLFTTHRNSGEGLTTTPSSLNNLKLRLDDTNHINEIILWPLIGNNLNTRVDKYS